VVKKDREGLEEIMEVREWIRIRFYWMMKVVFKEIAHETDTVGQCCFSKDKSQ
jgi:hypothetical protein